MTRLVWFVQSRSCDFCNATGLLTLCSFSIGLSSPSGPCFPGYYCTSEARIPNPVNDETGNLCPAGHYCPPGSSKPELCPTGTFLPQSGMAYRNACLPCPGGKFCQGEGLASVSGVYCMNLTSFLSPSLRVFFNVFWLLKPNTKAFLSSGTCYAGYFCDLGSTQPDHKHCPPGFYCPEGSESPVPCSAGSFNSDSGKWQSGDCQLCPAGYFCSGESLLVYLGTGGLHNVSQDRHPLQLYFLRTCR